MTISTFRFEKKRIFLVTLSNDVLFTKKKVQRHFLVNNLGHDHLLLGLKERNINKCSKRFGICNKRSKMLTKILGNNLSLPHDKSKYLVMVIQDLVNSNGRKRCKRLMG